jgi:hypothetical protein
MRSNLVLEFREATLMAGGPDRGGLAREEDAMKGGTRENGVRSLRTLCVTGCGWFISTAPLLKPISVRDR